MHGHGHNHDHGGHDGHAHGLTGEVGSASRRRLWYALAINAVFLGVEFVGGLVTDSLALLSDAGHMLTDVSALTLAIVVSHLALRPATPKRTFGLLRAEVIGAFLNGVALVLIVGLIFWEAVGRIGRHVEIDAPLMLVIAAVGLAANFASALVLYRSRGASVNVRAAFLHLAADALGSVGAVTAGIVIWATGWTPIDLIASAVIGLLILWSTLGLLRDTLNVLLNAVPRGIDYDEVRAALEANEHFTEIHDLHIWSVVEGFPVLTAHVELKPGCSDTDHWKECLQEAQTMLRDRFGIEHATIQLEPPGYERDRRRL